MNNCKKEHPKTKLQKYLSKYIFIVLGSLLVAIALNMFLIPNNLLDGGLTGISIITSKLTGLPLGLFIILFNLPFLVIGYKQIGKSFTISTLISILLLSLFTFLLEHKEPFTKDLFLATFIGSTVYGVGLGLILRNNAAVDGADTSAILVAKKTGFSVGEIIMFFNMFIFIAAGFLAFSWSSVMYSLVAYFLATKTVDVVIEGIETSKSVMIISDNYEEIADAIINRLGRGVTYLNGEGVYKKEEKKIIYTIITRLEVAKLKGIVKEIDQNCLIVIEHVHEVAGGNFRKKDIH
jgi:uncharacterized membrane-anchored protein YitT (DUF2179 family)